MEAAGTAGAGAAAAWCWTEGSACGRRAACAWCGCRWMRGGAAWPPACWMPAAATSCPATCCRGASWRSGATDPHCQPACASDWLLPAVLGCTLLTTARRTPPKAGVKTAVLPMLSATVMSRHCLQHAHRRRMWADRGLHPQPPLPGVRVTSAVAAAASNKCGKGAGDGSGQARAPCMLALMPPDPNCGLTIQSVLQSRGAANSQRAQKGED